MTWQYTEQEDFSGGMTFLQDDDAVAPNQLLVAENCFVDKDKRLKKYYPFTTAIANVPGGTTIYGVWYIRESAEYLILSKASTTYTLWRDLGTLNYDNFTSIHTWSGTGYLSVTPFDGIYLICGPNVTLRKFTPDVAGGTLAAVAGAPAAVYTVVYGNRVWGLTAGPENAIVFSDLDTYATWDALNKILQAPNGFTFTGLFPVDNALLLTTVAGAYLLRGTSLADLVIDPTPLYHGAVYGVSTETGIAYTDNGLIRISINGWEPVLKHISSGIGSGAGGFEPSMVPNTSFIQAQNDLIFTGASGFTGSVLIDMDYGAAFKLSTGISSAEFHVSNFFGSYLFVGDKYRNTSGTDTTSTFKIQTRHLGSELPGRKVWRALCIDLESAVNSVTVKYYLDHSSTPVTILNAGNLLAGENFLYEGLQHVQGETVSFEISTTSYVAALNRLIVKWKPYGKVKF